MPTIGIDPWGLFILQYVDKNNSNNVVTSTGELKIGTTNNGYGLFSYSDSPVLTKNAAGELVISLPIGLSINGSALKDSSSFEEGTTVTYVPHNGDLGSTLNLGIKEVAIAHEKGHADAFFRANFKGTMSDAIKVLNIDESLPLETISSQFYFAISRAHSSAIRGAWKDILSGADAPTISALEANGWKKVETEENVWEK